MGPDELSPVDAVALRRFLDGEQAIVREHVRAVIARPEFRKGEASPPTEQYREQVMEWARILARTGGPALLYPREFGGLGQVGAAITAFETLAHSDLSLLVKCGVQFGLFGGAVHHLGTRKHHEAYLQQIASLELPGCFAMSETGHGSNVQQVETVATWDGDAGRRVPQPDRKREPSLLHHARHAGAGPGKRGRRGDQRHQIRAHNRDPP